MQASPPHSSSRDLSLRRFLMTNGESDDCMLMHLRTPSPQTLNSPPPSTPSFILPPSSHVGESDPCNIHDVYGQLPDLYENDFSWENDDAFLHFDPHLGGQNQYQPTHITGDQVIYSDESDIGQGTYIKPIGEGKKPKPKTHKPSTSEHSDTSSTTKKKKKKLAKAKGKQRTAEGDDPPLDEAWEARLKDSIIQDEELYLRILRYEVCEILRRIALA